MADNSTLMAYLVPKLTSQVENAATDALAYILNRSAGSMQALNELLQEGGSGIEPIARVETQVTYKDGSRPDMAGYDKGNVVRLLVEAKFWAALLEGQASGYAQHFDQSGPAVLLFIAPELRIPTLWTEIRRQIEKQGGLELLDSSLGVQRARVNGTERQVMLVSWVRLIDRMDQLTGDDGVKSDIRQLRGLVQGQDAQAFLPIHSGELGPNPRGVSYSGLPSLPTMWSILKVYRKDGWISGVLGQHHRGMDTGGISDFLVQNGPPGLESIMNVGPATRILRSGSANMTPIGWHIGPPSIRSWAWSTRKCWTMWLHNSRR